VGVVLHGFLEHQQMEPAPGSIRAALAGQRLPVSQWEEGARRVGEALARLRGDARARWIFAPRESTRTELAATIVVESRPVRCVIDRTFVEDGTRWVIDFKSSVPSGDTEEFLASELELYRPQMERYAEVFRRLDDLPVRAALYFPLAGLWCEAELHATGRV
jgi:ATP-dependent exoDNAse (exonuclease V) beta subunit